MTLESDHHPEFTVTVDKEAKSVWVNGPVNCLGRFTPIGFEINRKFNSVEELMEVSTDSLDIRMKNLVPVDWDSFVTLMKIHHNIDLSEYDNPLL